MQDCGTGSPAQTTRSVREAHARAVEMLRLARGRLVNSSVPAVQAAAQRYFKITLPVGTDATGATGRTCGGRWRPWVAKQRPSTSASLEQRFIHGFCIFGNVGVTILNIHLCPAWWTYYSDLDRRAAVLIHEWGHRFGTGVATIFETYCFAAGYAPASAEDLITWPDAYMQFVWDLSIGAPAPCF